MSAWLPFSPSALPCLQLSPQHCSPLPFLPLPPRAVRPAAGPLPGEPSCQPPFCRPFKASGAKGDPGGTAGAAAQGQLCPWRKFFPDPTQPEGTSAGPQRLRCCPHTLLSSPGAAPPQHPHPLLQSSQDPSQWCPQDANPQVPAVLCCAHPAGGLGLLPSELSPQIAAPSHPTALLPGQIWAQAPAPARGQQGTVSPAPGGATLPFPWQGGEGGGFVLRHPAARGGVRGDPGELRLRAVALPSVCRASAEGVRQGHEGLPEAQQSFF